MKTDIEILFTRLRLELPIVRSKKFLSWAKESYPDKDLHHLLGSSMKEKYTDLLIAPLEHWKDHPQAHKNLAVAFEEFLPLALTVLSKYIEHLEREA